MITSSPGYLLLFSDIPKLMVPNALPVHEVASLSQAFGARGESPQAAN